MSDIGDILRDKQFAEPPEIKAIKQYVKEHFKAEVGITMRPDTIILTVHSAALANALRFDAQQLSEACHLTQRLVYRIS